MLARASRRRCPHCGGRAWFRGWFAKDERCRTCGYRYERDPGFLLGALTVNTVVTFGVLAVILVVGFVVTYPDIAMVPILAVALPAVVVVPIVFYPFSYTIWSAVDLAMRPLEPAEEADAAAYIAARSEPPAGRQSGP
jgi:uncharacterized protein (DUF983 family)